MDFIPQSPVLHSRPWGVEPGCPAFALRYASEVACNGGGPIGEAWLTGNGCPVLVKMLFTSQPLSVQVHPDDEYAARHGLGRGKSEMWYVIAASPGAEVGVGWRAGVSPQEFEAACRAGRGAELLERIAVAPGDALNVPAGTVHAIGAGLVLCEVQQNSDTTFRLDDYGRRDAEGGLRELHLEAGFAVMRATAAGRVVPGLAPGESGRVFAGPYFRLERYELAAGARGRVEADAEGRARVLVNAGECAARVADRRLAPGAALAAETAAPAWEWIADRATTLLAVTAA